MRRCTEILQVYPGWRLGYSHSRRVGGGGVTSVQCIDGMLGALEGISHGIAISEVVMFNTEISWYMKMYT